MHILPPLSNRIINTSIAVAMATMMTGCFTGIESTPKITANDVRKQKITDRPEDSYLSSVTSEPLESWQQGKEFYVTDNKISLLFGASGANSGMLNGTILRFKEIKNVISVTGRQVAELTLTTAKGNDVTYRLEQSIETIKKNRHVNIPFTTELSVVHAVSKIMKGQRYYMITSSWYDTENKARTGRKFVPVTVTDVQPGNTVYPILLIMADENGEPFHLYMSIGDNTNSTRKFQNLFSLTDPHLRYPNISENTWKHIINGQVTEEMTRDECRLSLGSPASIDRRPGYSIMREIWTYENGIYLIFEDGLLRNFRR